MDGLILRYQSQLNKIDWNNAKLYRGTIRTSPRFEGFFESFGDPKDYKAILITYCDVHEDSSYSRYSTVLLECKDDGNNLVPIYVDYAGSGGTGETGLFHGKSFKRELYYGSYYIRMQDASKYLSNSNRYHVNAIIFE